MERASETSTMLGSSLARGRAGLLNFFCFISHQSDVVLGERFSSFFFLHVARPRGEAKGACNGYKIGLENGNSRWACQRLFHFFWPFFPINMLTQPCMFLGKILFV